MTRLEQTILRIENVIAEKKERGFTVLQFSECYCDPEIIDQVAETFRNKNYTVEVKKQDDIFNTQLPQPAFLKINWS